MKEVKKLYDYEITIENDVIIKISHTTLKGRVYIYKTDYKLNKLKTLKKDELTFRQLKNGVYNNRIFLSVYKL